ncbi:hypothetical protein OAU93_02675 [bacterium]|nr:hypothetical protein [bacterium]
MDRSLEDKQSPKTRHRWLQLRLRSLLVLVTLLAIVFGRRAVSVGLSGTKVSDLSPLNDPKNLHYLDLSETDVSDLIPLTGL